MKIDEEDFKSFISIKQSLDVNSVRLCVIRVRVINRWFTDKELTKENIEKFFRELQLSGRRNNTLNCYYFVFSHLRDYFKDRGWAADFFDGFKSFKKTKAAIIILTPEEIEKIYNTPLEFGKQNGRDCSFLDFRYRTLIMFLALTGCRMSEAVDLQIKRLDINAGKAIFIETKTNENRTANFSEPLTSKLRVLIEGKNLMIWCLGIRKKQGCRSLMLVMILKEEHGWQGLQNGYIPTFSVIVLRLNYSCLG